jgi:Glycosyl transferase WecG/TagA/CpsF family
MTRQGQETVQNLGGGGPPTSNGENLTRWETGLPATTTFSRFCSPPRFWMVSLAGVERRAPVLVQQASLEWAWRLAQNPRRLWRRYLVDDPAILWLLSAR